MTSVSIMVTNLFMGSVIICNWSARVRRRVSEFLNVKH